jgi:PcfJ-like protein
MTSWCTAKSSKQEITECANSINTDPRWTRWATTVFWNDVCRCIAQATDRHTTIHGIRVHRIVCPVNRLARFVNAQLIPQECRRAWMRGSSVWVISNSNGNLAYAANLSLYNKLQECYDELVEAYPRQQDWSRHTPAQLLASHTERNRNRMRDLTSRTAPGDFSGAVRMTGMSWMRVGAELLSDLEPARTECVYTTPELVVHRLCNQMAYITEGREMRHCVAQYWMRQESEIYSLRLTVADAEPTRLTVELKDERIAQIKGVDNRAITATEIPCVSDWVQTLGIDVAKCDALNLNTLVYEEVLRRVVQTRLRGGNMRDLSLRGLSSYVYAEPVTIITVPRTLSPVREHIDSQVEQAKPVRTNTNNPHYRRIKGNGSWNQ